MDENNMVSVDCDPNAKVFLIQLNVAFAFVCGEWE